METPRISSRRFCTGLPFRPPTRLAVGFGLDALPAFGWIHPGRWQAVASVPPLLGAEDLADKPPQVQNFESGPQRRDQSSVLRARRQIGGAGRQRNLPAGRFVCSVCVCCAARIDTARVLRYRSRAARVAHHAQVAQLVEQRTENPRVGGSIPSLGTTMNPATPARAGVFRARLIAPARAILSASWPSNQEISMRSRRGSAIDLPTAITSSAL
jgi:hypothetical protein